MHGPGGGRYYAAIWANDQAEYANPFFGYLGEGNPRASALQRVPALRAVHEPGLRPDPELDHRRGAPTPGTARRTAATRR